MILNIQNIKNKMSLYSLNKDMLIQLILERDSFEKLSNEELWEKRNNIDNVLLRRKAGKLDSNVEHKEIIQKHKEYFLSASVTFSENINNDCQIIGDCTTCIFISSIKGDISVHLFEDCEPYVEIENRRQYILQDDLRTYEKTIQLLQFLEEIN